MRFGTIVCDPPWPYAKTSGHAKLTGYSEDHYAPLSMAELLALPVAAVAADSCVLLLWTTPVFIAEGHATRLAEAWGFTPRTSLFWVKTTRSCTAKDPDAEDLRLHHGVGYWFLGCVEPILVASKGKFERNQTRSRKKGCIVAPVTGHSTKPPDLHRIAEEHYPGPRLELFARCRVPGWVALGNEVEDGMDIRESLAAFNVASDQEVAEIWGGA